MSYCERLLLFIPPRWYSKSIVYMPRSIICIEGVFLWLPALVFVWCTTYLKSHTSFKKERGKRNKNLCWYLTRPPKRICIHFSLTKSTHLSPPSPLTPPPLLSVPIHFSSSHCLIAKWVKQGVSLDYLTRLSKPSSAATRNSFDIPYNPIVCRSLFLVILLMRVWWERNRTEAPPEISWTHSGDL